MIKTLLSTAAMVMLHVSPTMAADPGRVSWRDLDLSTPAGAAELDRRVAQAASEPCRRSWRQPVDQQCVRAVQRSVTADLPATARADYARARRVSQH